MVAWCQLLFCFDVVFEDVVDLLGLLILGRLQGHDAGKLVGAVLANPHRARLPVFLGDQRDAIRLIDSLGAKFALETALDVPTTGCEAADTEFRAGRPLDVANPHLHFDDGQDRAVAGLVGTTVFFAVPGTAGEAVASAAVLLDDTVTGRFLGTGFMLQAVAVVEGVLQHGLAAVAVDILDVNALGPDEGVWRSRDQTVLADERLGSDFGCVVGLAVAFAVRAGDAAEDRHHFELPLDCRVKPILAFGAERFEGLGCFVGVCRFHE